MKYADNNRRSHFLRHPRVCYKVREFKELIALTICNVYTAQTVPLKLKELLSHIKYYNVAKGGPGIRKQAFN